MKFAYKKYGKNQFGEDVFRPVIPIKIINGDKFVWYEALIDSGADSNIFDSEIGELINIKIANGKQEFYSGVTGSKRISYIHNIEIEVGGWRYKTGVAFAPGISRVGHGIVGQKGFFNLFIVKFDYKKKQIELNQKSFQ